MVVGDIIPDGDATPNGWLYNPLPHWSRIDEDKGSVVCTVAESVIADNTHNGALEQYTFTTLTDIVANSITQVKVWSHGNKFSDSNLVEVAISWNDGVSFSSYVDTNFAGGTPVWHSNTWSGLSYSKADLDKFQTSYRATVAGAFDWLVLCCVYVEITYTSSVVGYTHKFLGVLPANIGKISGVATANIGKVKGV